MIVFPSRSIHTSYVIIQVETAKAIYSHTCVAYILSLETVDSIWNNTHGNRFDEFKKYIMLRVSLLADQIVKK